MKKTCSNCLHFPEPLGSAPCKVCRSFNNQGDLISASWKPRNLKVKFKILRDKIFHR